MCRGLITVETLGGFEAVLNPAAILAITPRGYDATLKVHTSAVVLPGGEKLFMKGSPRQVLAAIRFFATAAGADEGEASSSSTEACAIAPGGADAG